MKQLFLFVFFAILIIGCKKERQIQTNKTIPISKSKRVLDSIILVSKENSLYKDKVDWRVLEKEVYKRFIDSDSITAIIKPVTYLLHQLEDFHGYLLINNKRFGGNVTRNRNVSYDYTSQNYIHKMSAIYQKSLAQKEINAAIIDGNIAYIEIPMMMPYGGSNKDVIENLMKIRKKICKLKQQKPKGWIIDLRSNLGGSMYPMLMGIAALLPSTINLGGDSKDGKTFHKKWILKEGIFYYGKDSYADIPKMNCQTDTEKNKIAVLIGRYTTSAGETVASSLKGQENVKLFGEQTSGATTSLLWQPFGKDIVYNYAISYYTSKDLTVHKDGVIPDVVLPEDFNFENPTNGKVISKAVQWIQTGF